DLGLDAALRWLARQVAGGNGLIDVEVGALPADLDNDLSTLVFRVAQEALANAGKHAQAGSIVLRLAQRGDQLMLLVVDDGVGCDVEQAFAKSSHGDSTGLASIRERVRLFGGRLAIDSRPGEGLQLRVTLPLATGASA